MVFLINLNSVLFQSTMQSIPLFTPYMMESLSSLGVKPDIIDLIHKGTELEDFAAFNLSIDDTVTVCLQRTEELLKQYKNVEFNDKILINWRVIQK